MKWCLHRQVLNYRGVSVSYGRPKIDYEHLKQLPHMRAAVLERAKLKSPNKSVPLCEMPGCMSIAREIHHTDYHIDNPHEHDMIAVCEKCHSWLHRHDYPRAANADQFDLPLEKKTG